jgi:hypothetical protein
MISSTGIECKSGLYLTILTVRADLTISSTGIVGKPGLYLTVLSVRADQRSLQLE